MHRENIPQIANAMRQALYGDMTNHQVEGVITELAELGYLRITVKEAPDES